MKAVLRLALTCFSIWPLQTVLSVFGAALIVLALAAAALPGPPGEGAAVAAIFGAMLAAPAPALAGGLFFHRGSSRSTVHLRPRGRWKMLGAALLVITAIAVLALIPYWLINQSGMAVPGGSRPSLMELAGAAWSRTALLWLALYFSARSRYPLTLVPLTYLAFASASVRYEEIFPGLVASIAFGFWYLRAGTAQPWLWLEKLQAASPLARSWRTTCGRLSAWLQQSFAREDNSNGAALNTYLLGYAPLGTALLTGTMVTVGLLVLDPVQQNGHDGKDGFLVMCAGLVTQAISIGVGYTTTRRTRYLWLRHGLDRSQLFRFAERTGLQVVGLWLACTAGTLSLYAAVKAPTLLPGMLAIASLQLTFASSLFYLGLWLARERGDDADVGASVLMALLLLALSITTVVVVNAPQLLSLTLLSVLLPSLSLLLAALFRWLAYQRWLRQDWYLVRPSTRPFLPLTRTGS